MAHEATVPWRFVEEAGPHPAWRILYGAVIALVALGGLVTIVEWAQRGGELPGGGMPVTGRVIQEEPGFSGSLAIVEVAYDAGGKARRARLPVAGSDEQPGEPMYRAGDTVALLVSREDPGRVQHASWNSGTPNAPIPGWVLALGAGGLMAALVARAFTNWRRERCLSSGHRSQLSRDIVHTSEQGVGDGHGATGRGGGAGGRPVQE